MAYKEKWRKAYEAYVTFVLTEGFTILVYKKTSKYLPRIKLWGLFTGLNQKKYSAKVSYRQFQNPGIREVNVILVV